jgi:hypothetical protein
MLLSTDDEIRAALKELSIFSRTVQRIVRV